MTAAECTLAAARSPQRPSGRPPPGRSRRRSPAAVAAGLAVAAGILPAALTSSPAGAATVGTLQSRASAIAAQIIATNTKLQVLSEEYDQAKLRAASLDSQIESDRSALGRAEGAVHNDSANLRHQAVSAYVNAGSTSGLSAVMTGSENSLPLQQAYLQAASGSLRTAMTSLQDSEHQLSVRQSTLQKAESQAAQNEQTLAVSKQSANALLGQLSAAQQQVKGQLATAVARQEAIQQRQQAARAAAQQAAAQTVAQAAAQPSPPTPPVTPTLSVSSSGSSQGAAAVAAAETQEGVPYVWAGATPGQGFDCSGLTMWAWGQAGVNLPHSAQAQYDSIEHISMSQLQPGDLIFYASGGYIYHVIMYIGNGQAIQAEDTGTVVHVMPVWPGAYGAGRP